MVAPACGNSKACSKVYIYTPIVYEMFQKELWLTWNLNIQHVGDIGTTSQYYVNTYGKSYEHSLTFDACSGELKCSCKKFDFVGILCCHALKVLDARNIRRIPSEYVMKRWCTDSKV